MYACIHTYAHAHKHTWIASGQSPFDTSTFELGEELVMLYVHTHTHTNMHGWQMGRLHSTLQRLNLEKNPWRFPSIGLVEQGRPVVLEYMQVRFIFLKNA